MPTGTVKWFNTTKGYGFIEPSEGGNDVFVHISAVEKAGLNGLISGEAVKYDLSSVRGEQVGALLAYQGKSGS